MPKFSAPQMWVRSSNEGPKHLPFPRGVAPVIRLMGSSHYCFLPGFHTWSTNSLDSPGCMSLFQFLFFHSLHPLRSRSSIPCSNWTCTSLQRRDQPGSGRGFSGSQKSTAGCFFCSPLLAGSPVGPGGLRMRHDQYIAGLDQNTSTDLCHQ